MYSVGLMSGTSLDGIDAALVEIQGQGRGTKVKLLEFITLDIPDDIKEEIRRCVKEETSSIDLACSLNFKLGYQFANAVKEVCKKAELPLDKLDFIASHGQTVFHIPKAYNNFIPSTLQIGESAIIAYECRAKVISNFRVMDVAAGGAGAPLVPYSETILYGDDNKSIALQNIGGIGNVSVIPSKNSEEEVFAFDTGPGNMIIDEVCYRLFNQKYDDGGKIAAQGIVNKKMLDRLMSHEYILKAIPKTTGREEFGEEFVDKLLDEFKHVSPNDIVATVTMFTAKSITENYRRFILDKIDLSEVIIGGGGAHNDTLLHYLRELLPELKIMTQDEYGYSSDAKEAIAFVIMGNETLYNSYSNVPSATGAREKVILGNITPNPFGEF